MAISNEDIREVTEDYKYVIVKTLLTEKPIKFHVMRDTLASVWRPRKGMCIKEVTTNRFLFQFFHEFDTKRVLEDGPWAFEQSLLVLKKLNMNESPLNVSLTTSGLQDLGQLQLTANNG